MTLPYTSTAIAVNESCPLPRAKASAFFEDSWRVFLRAKKPGFPLQLLGFAHANPAGFPLQSLAPHGLTPGRGGAGRLKAALFYAPSGFPRAGLVGTLL
jgi:hypothetical protein